jgi:hypothetical protein
MLLEFINELMHPDASLPKDTYEAKRYLKDLGLEYEKISACRKGCMLFWRENKNWTNVHSAMSPGGRMT